MDATQIGVAPPPMPGQHVVVPTVALHCLSQGQCVHGVAGAYFTHDAPAQTSLGAQTTPHAPQYGTLVVRSTHAVVPPASHAVLPPVHAPVPHVLLSHLPPGVHAAALQLPQWFGSEVRSVQLVPHTEYPGKQLHAVWWQKELCEHP